MPPIARTSALLALLLAVPCWARAESPAAPSPTPAESQATVREDAPYPYEDSIDVHLVNLEVYVTNRRGEPVTGLTADDFEILEDGEPRILSHFAEIRPRADRRVGSMERDPGVPEEPMLSADPTASAKPAAAVEPSHLVIYFDNANLRTAGRERLIRDLRTFLASEPVPAEQILILSQRPALKVEAPFGSTLTELDAALVEQGTVPAQGHGIDRERHLVFDRLYEIWDQARNTPFLEPCGEMATAGVREVDSYGQGVKGRVSRSLAHLATLSSALAGIPGSKSVLYVGDGLELLPGSDMAHFLVELCPHRERDILQISYAHDLTHRFERLSRHANANRVTFYPLEAAGPRTGSSASVEFSDLKFTPSSVNDRVRLANLQNSLSFLADDTGGRAVFGKTRFADDLADIGRDLGAYYSLAFDPGHDGDDRVHRLEVKLPGKKRLRVRHRLSYRGKPGDERMADRLQTALTLGRLDNPLGVHLGHGAITPLDGRGRRFEVPLRVTVPLDRLVFLQQDDEPVGRVRLQIAARDDEGRTTAFHQKHFEVALHPEQDGRPRGHHTFVVDLEMRGGEHVVAVAFRDDLGRETTYLASRILVASETGGPAGPGSP
ncbi:MAG: VWA domain-containing protein [Acidobacteriota bacterium]